MISLILITTNYQYRFPFLLKTLESIAKFQHIIDEIIVSIDFFTNFEKCYEQDYILEQLKQLPYITEILIKSPNGMIANQLNALSHSHGDYIIYSEDDISVCDIPCRETIRSICDCGVIVYNTHYTNSNIPQRTIDINLTDNYHTINRDFFFKKKRSTADEYYITFPLAIMKRQVLIDTYHYMRGQHENIEVGFSKTLRKLPQYQTYDVYIYLDYQTYQKSNTFKAQMKYRDNDSELNTKADTIKPIRDYCMFDRLSSEDLTKIDNLT